MVESGFVQVFVPLVGAVLAYAGQQSAQEAAAKQSTLAAQNERDRLQAQTAGYWSQVAASQGGGTAATFPAPILIGGVALGAFLLWRASRG